MKLIHLTDPHFNFTPPGYPKKFGNAISSAGDIVVITGDTSEHPTLEDHLTEFAEGFGKPVYFVLGNHCRMNGGFKRTFNLARKIHFQYSNINYLPEEPLELSKDSVLIGSDGHYDCSVGNPYKLGMSEFSMVDEYIGEPIDNIISFSKNYAASLAMEADFTIRKAAMKYKSIYFATHVPPFPDPEHKDNTWDPWFLWITMGNALAGIAEDFPDNSFVILAGHRHKPYTYRQAHNMIQFVGAAEYNYPAIAKVYDI